jgi:FtsZ-interacting cell division protein YlmF
MAYLIKGAHVVDPQVGLDDVCDVLVEDKTIVEVAKDIEAAEGVEIIDHMMYGRIVLVNEERLSPELSRRMTDSLSGAAYALGGKLLRVGSLKAVVFTPHGVALLNDQLDELESSILKF